MTDYLEYFIANPDAQVNAEYRGITFKNETPELINLFKAIHDPFYPTTETKNLPATKCDKVLCVMEQYYGKDLPLRMLYIYAKFGLSTSPEAAFKPSFYRKWKLSEINDLLVALESLPPQFLPIPDSLLLHLSSAVKEKKDVIANSRITVFDVWDEQSRAVRISSIIHEFGHIYYWKFNLRQQWKSMPRQYVSKYAQTSDGEDFAESFTAYRLAPQKLKIISPERYQFIKENVFHGLEFKNTKDCDAPFNQYSEDIQNQLMWREKALTWSNKNKPKISEQVKRQEERGNFKKIIWSTCAVAYFNEINGDSRNLTNQCLANIVRRRATLLELRKNNSEITMKQISSENLQDIEVSQRTIQLLRQDLKIMATEQLDQAFRNNLLIYPKTKECLDSIEFFLSYYLVNYSELNIPSSGIKTVLTQACKNRDQNHFWAGWLTSEFAPLLPN